MSQKPASVSYSSHTIKVRPFPPPEIPEVMTDEWLLQHCRLDSADWKEPQKVLDFLELRRLDHIRKNPLFILQDQARFKARRK